MNNVLYIEDYINELEKEFLENGDKKYIELCKNIYGANIEKISINIWTSHIMDEFREKIVKDCNGINNIDEISKKIYNSLKEYRKKIIVYSYLKGHICGYNDYKLIMKFKFKYKDKIIDSDEKILLKHDELEKLIDFIKFNKSEDFSIDTTLNNIKMHYLKNIEKNISHINIDFDKEKVVKTVEDIIVEEIIQKYNEGILYSIIHKINKKGLKINKIGL